MGERESEIGRKREMGRKREENTSIDHIQYKIPFKRVIALRVRERDERERWRR